MSYCIAFSKYMQIGFERGGFDFGFEDWGNRIDLTCRCLFYTSCYAEIRAPSTNCFSWLRAVPCHNSAKSLC